jgi:hypothetical protein
LKYQTPSGYDGRFQSKWRARRYKTTEAITTQPGLRTSAHNMRGNARISTIYRGSASMLRLVFQRKRCPKHLNKFDPCGVHTKQQHFSDIDLPSSPENPRDCYHGAMLEHDSCVHNRGGKAGDKDEQIGRITKSVVFSGDPIEYVVWDVIYENLPVCKPAKEVEPQVSTFGRKRYHRRKQC